MTTTIDARWMPVLLIALLGVACQDTPTGTSSHEVRAELADTVILAPGDTVTVGLLRLTFVEVSADSRCPIDATCVWQGDATVSVAVGPGMGPLDRYAMHTHEGASWVDALGFRITLLELLPVPQAAIPIPPGDYRATLGVAPLPDTN